MTSTPLLVAIGRATILAQHVDLVILDLDGTIVKPIVGQPKKPEFRANAEDWEIIGDRWELIAGMQRVGLALAIATNQGGVAYHFLEPIAMHREVCKAAYMLGIWNVQVCFAHPKSNSNRFGFDSPMRKPRPGMLLRAMEDANATADRTLMVGDLDDDEKAAAAAGCRFMNADAFFRYLAGEAEIITF